jgi:NitT/TauT family transport system substrate-binding protein
VLELDVGPAAPPGVSSGPPVPAFGDLLLSASSAAVDAVPEAGWSRRRFGGLVLGGAAGLGAGAVAGLAGCSGGGRCVAAGQKLREVTSLTTFGDNGRDSFAYVAKDKGFFAEAGLDVDVQLGNAGDYNHNLLRAGQAQFATVDASGALLRYGNGLDTSFLILGLIHQQTLLSIVTMTGYGINAPAQLAGKRIGMVAGSAPETMFPGYARLAGIESHMAFTHVDGRQLNTLLLTGKLDGIGVFSVSAAALKATDPQHREPVVLPYNAYFTDLPGAVVVAQADTVKKDPGLCRAFTSALLRGLAYTVAHPEEAGQILARVRKPQNAAIAAGEITLMKPYVSGVVQGNGVRIGHLDATQMMKASSALQAVGVSARTVYPDELCRFTMVDDAIVAKI